VIFIVALLMSFSIPAIRSFMNSYENVGSARPAINAAFATAKSIAARNQTYAGVRFQRAYDELGKTASQYMIFVIKENVRYSNGNLRNGYKVAPGLKPVKLPDSIAVSDIYVRTSDTPSTDTDELVTEDYLRDSNTSNDDPDGNNKYITDLCAFTVLFSPQGKLVVKSVRVRNRDGRTFGTQTATISSDEIFNTLEKVKDADPPVGMFLQDDYPGYGLGSEYSRRRFVIYDRARFEQMNAENRYEYLTEKADYVSINAYTGEIIGK